MNKIAGIVGLVVILAAVGGAVYFLSNQMGDVDTEYSVGENLEELYGDVTGHTVNGFEKHYDSELGNRIVITGTYTLADGTTHDFSMTFDMDTKERISP